MVILQCSPCRKKPSPIEWKLVEPETLAKKLVLPDPEYYKKVFQSIGTAVDETLQAHGQPSLAPHSKGRAQTLEVRWVQEHSAPVKKPREGEHNPSYHGLNQQHSRWTRQYRRLVNFARLSQNLTGSQSQTEHRGKLWQSIRKAAGVQPNLTRWFQENVADADSIQVSPPDHQKALSICQAFHNIKNLIFSKKQLNTHRVQTAKQRRHDDPW